MRTDDTTLTRAIQEGMMRMDPHRRVRAQICSEIAGPWYGQFVRGSNRELMDRRPVNVLSEMVYAYLAQLVGNHVKTKVYSKTQFYRGHALLKQYALNDLAREIDLAKIFRLTVLDALTGGVGIVRVGNRSGHEECHIEGQAFDIGQIYAARVDLDDYCRDPMSREESEDRWRAYRYRTTRDMAIELWPEMRDTIMAAPLVRDNLMTSYDSGLEELSGARGRQDETSDVIELWDWFGYEKGKVLTCTLAGNVDALKKIKPVAEYEGWEGGPLHMLSFRHIPNQAQPIAICQQLLDIHLAMANTSAKLVDQIMCAKTAYVTRADGEQTAHELRDARDQDVFIGDPTAITPIEIGGGMRQLFGAFDWLRSEANNASGAASLIAGQSDVSKTATGATYMANQANVRLSDMKGSVQKFMSQVITHCAWYMDNHPNLIKTFKHKLPGTLGTIDIQYDDAAKEGSFTEFIFDIIPETQSNMDPAMKLARVGQFMQMAPPFIQMVQQMGGDVQAAMQQLGEMFDWPELGELFPTQEYMMMNIAMVNSFPATAQNAAQPQAPGGNPIEAGRMAPGAAPAEAGPARGPINQTRSDMAATMPAASQGF